MTATFKKVETLLALLSMGEKAQLLNRVSKELGETFPGIEKTELGIVYFFLMMGEFGYTGYSKINGIFHRYKPATPPLDL